MASEESKSPDNRLQVTICGGGNGAHAFVVTVASKFLPRFRVNWLSLYADEADRINDKLSQNNGYLKGVFVQENALISVKPNIVTKDASKVIPNSDIIILCVPAFAHTEYLDVINKYHEICTTDSKDLNNLNKKNLIIAAFPSASGLEFAFKKLIRNHDHIALFSCLTLPWACRIIEYGVSVEILGIKEEIGNFVHGSDKLLNEIKPLERLQSIFLDNKPILKCDQNIHILSATIGSTNPVIHSSIMYNQWSDYDGKTLFDEKPLFYQGINQNAADLMSSLSNEMLAIGKKYNELGSVNNNSWREIKFPHVHEWYLDSYGQSCGDASSLFSIIRTNPGYNGLTHPMKKSESDPSKFVPNFGYRYLTEDVPFGLIVTKAMAILLDESKNSVKTPILDKTLQWAEKVMNKKYFIIDEKSGLMKLDLNSKDLAKTRVPQLFGFQTTEDILKM